MKPLSDEPTRIEIAGHHLQCHHCSKEQFQRRRLRRQTASASGMRVDWHEAVAHAFICAHCGFLLEFLTH